MKTHVATSTATGVTVRGRDLVDELIGHRTFTEMTYFLLTGTMPEPEQTRVLDACLVTLMEHGWTPSSLVARLVADSVPGQVQVGIAAGLLAIGDVFAGTMEGCGNLLAGIAASGDPAAACRAAVADHRARRRPIPGFGHPVHKPDDPRSARLLAIARATSLPQRCLDLLDSLSAEVDRAYGRHITINATGAIAALLLAIGIPPSAMRSLAVISRAGGLAGHLVEEQATHAARTVWELAEEHIPYEDPPG